MIRILAIGDPHFKTNNSYETDIMHREVINVIKSRQPDSVVCLGDILDKFELIHVKVFNRVLSFIEDMANESKDVNLLIGNHDRPNNNVFLTEDHPFNAIKKWNNITVVDKVLIKEIKGAPFVLTPYVAVGRFNEALKTVELDYKTDDQVQHSNLQSMAGVFAHNEFYGAKMGIIKSVEGDIWPLNAPFLVSGHIHDYDQLQPNLYYTGTPIQHGMTDSGDKTISLFTYNLVDGKWKMTEEERIDLNIPKKLKLKLTKEELLDFKLIVNASMIRIDIEIDPIEYKNLLKDSRIINLLDAGVKIKPIDTRVRVHSNNLKLPVKMLYSKRLISSIKNSELEVQTLFEELFGDILESPNKKVITIKLENITTKRKKSNKKTDSTTPKKHKVIKLVVR